MVRGGGLLLDALLVSARASRVFVLSLPLDFLNVF